MRAGLVAPQHGAAMAYTHTTTKELELMSQWHVDKGMPPAAIAALLGRHRSTIVRRLTNHCSAIGEGSRTLEKVLGLGEGVSVIFLGEDTLGKIFLGVCGR